MDIVRDNVSDDVPPPVPARRVYSTSILAANGPNGAVVENAAVMGIEDGQPQRVPTEYPAAEAAAQKQGEEVDALKEHIATLVLQKRASLQRAEAQQVLCEALSHQLLALTQASNATSSGGVVRTTPHGNHHSSPSAVGVKGANADVQSPLRRRSNSDCSASYHNHLRMAASSSGVTTTLAAAGREGGGGVIPTLASGSLDCSSSIHNGSPLDLSTVPADAESWLVATFQLSQLQNKNEELIRVVQDLQSAMAEADKAHKLRDEAAAVEAESLFSRVTILEQERDQLRERVADYALLKAQRNRLELASRRIAAPKEARTAGLRRLEASERNAMAAHDDLFHLRRDLARRGPVSPLCLVLQTFDGLEELRGQSPEMVPFLLHTYHGTLAAAAASRGGVLVARWEHFACYAFQFPNPALAFAAACQVELHQYDWPDSIVYCPPFRAHRVPPPSLQQQSAASVAPPTSPATTGIPARHAVAAQQQASTAGTSDISTLPPRVGALQHYYHGPRIRCYVHYGNPSVDVHPGTGSLCYFGQDVSVAVAVLAFLARPGEICANVVWGEAVRAEAASHHGAEVPRVAELLHASGYQCEDRVNLPRVLVAMATEPKRKSMFAQVPPPLPLPLSVGTLYSILPTLLRHRRDTLTTAPFQPRLDASSSAGPDSKPREVTDALMAFVVMASRSINGRAFGAECVTGDMTQWIQRVTTNARFLLTRDPVELAAAKITVPYPSSPGIGVSTATPQPMSPSSAMPPSLAHSTTPAATGSSAGAAAGGGGGQRQRRSIHGRDDVVAGTTPNLGSRQSGDASSGSSPLHARGSDSASPRRGSGKHHHHNSNHPVGSSGGANHHGTATFDSANSTGPGNPASPSSLHGAASPSSIPIAFPPLTDIAPRRDTSAATHREARLFFMATVFQKRAQEYERRCMEREDAYLAAKQRPMTAMQPPRCFVTVDVANVRHFEGFEEVRFLQFLVVFRQLVLTTASAFFGVLVRDNKEDVHVFAFRETTDAFQFTSALHIRFRSEDTLNSLCPDGVSLLAASTPKLTPTAVHLRCGVSFGDLRNFARDPLNNAERSPDQLIFIDGPVVAQPGYLCAAALPGETLVSQRAMRDFLSYRKNIVSTEYTILNRGYRVYRGWSAATTACVYSVLPSKLGLGGRVPGISTLKPPPSQRGLRSQSLGAPASSPAGAASPLVAPSTSSPANPPQQPSAKSSDLAPVVASQSSTAVTPPPSRDVSQATYSRASFAASGPAATAASLATVSPSSVSIAVGGAVALMAADGGLLDRQGSVVALPENALPFLYADQTPSIDYDKIHSVVCRHVRRKLEFLLSNGEAVTLLRSALQSRRRLEAVERQLMANEDLTLRPDSYAALILANSTSPLPSSTVAVPPQLFGRVSPTGTVLGGAVLYVDVEGSAKLLEAVPDAFQKAQQHANYLIRDAISANNGFPFRTNGTESWLAFFVSCESALEAAVAIHQQFMASDWPAELVKQEKALRVRDSKSGVLLFHGLRPRIGIAGGGTGTSSTAVSVVAAGASGKVDIVGPSVLEAIRIGKSASGGDIWMTLEMYHELEGKCVSNPPSVSAALFDAHVLYQLATRPIVDLGKLGETIAVSCVLRSLEGRFTRFAPYQDRLAKVTSQLEKDLGSWWKQPASLGVRNECTKMQPNASQKKKSLLLLSGGFDGTLQSTWSGGGGVSGADRYLFAVSPGAPPPAPLPGFVVAALTDRLASVDAVLPTASSAAQTPLAGAAAAAKAQLLSISASTTTSNSPGKPNDRPSHASDGTPLGGTGHPTATSLAAVCRGVLAVLRAQPSTPSNAAAFGGSTTAALFEVPLQKLDDACRTLIGRSATSPSASASAAGAAAGKLPALSTTRAPRPPPKLRGSGATGSSGSAKRQTEK